MGLVLGQKTRASCFTTALANPEVSRRMEMIWSGCYHRPDGVGLFWSKILGGDKPIFTEQPNALLVSAIQGRKPGRALDF